MATEVSFGIELKGGAAMGGFTLGCNGGTAKHSGVGGVDSTSVSMRAGLLSVMARPIPEPAALIDQLSNVLHDCEF